MDSLLVTQEALITHSVTHHLVEHNQIEFCAAEAILQLLI